MSNFGAKTSTPPDGFVSLMGRLTVFVSNNTMALVEDGEVLGPMHLDMGNSGLGDLALERAAV